MKLFLQDKANPMAIGHKVLTTEMFWVRLAGIPDFNW